MMPARVSAPAASPLLALREALEPESIYQSLAGSWTGRRLIAAELVSESPGKRAVIRYGVSSTDGTTPALIGKLYADPRRAQRAHTVLEQLHNAMPGSEGLHTPRPVALLPGLGLSLQEFVAGGALDGLPDAERHAAVVSAAGWLAALHDSGIRLERDVNPASESQKLDAWAELVAQHDAALAGESRELRRRLGSFPEPRPAARVALHRDFQYQHVLYRDHRICAIDLDEMRMGEAALDVAHFAANLRLLAFRETGNATALGALEDAFVDAYAERREYTRDERHTYFLAHASLKIAKQLVRGRGPAPAPIGDAITRQAGTMLAEGLRCLTS